MRYKAGESGNKAGRPKGAKGKTPQELQRIIIQFVSRNIDEMQEIYDGLKPEQKLEIIYRFSKLILPKEPSEAGTTKQINVMFYPEDLNL